MKRIVFLIYHGLGHFNACFRVARVLQEKYEVHFAGVEYFEKYVTDQGFRYYPLKTVPFGLGFESWFNTIHKSKFPYLQTLRDRWTNRLYKLRYAELKKMMDHLLPETILIDSLQSTDFLVLSNLLKERHIRIALLQTMPSTVLQPGKPPINSLAFPGDDKAIQKAHKTFRWKRRKKIALQKIKYFGKDDGALIHAVIEQHPEIKKYVSPYLTPLGIVIAFVPELILVPGEFELPYESLPGQYYIGFMPDKTRKENIDASYQKIKQLLREKSLEGVRVIYCSFGTVQSKDLKTIRRFVKKLLLAVERSDYLLIIASPVHHEEIKPSGPVQENVLFVKSVPQLDLLSHTDVFITHGGINSIKEAVHAGVPMLACPIDHNFDQPGNSVRVAFHQLGLRGDIRHDSSEDIKKKIHELIMNPLYKQRLADMALVDDSYTAEKLKFLFEGIQPL